MPSYLTHLIFKKLQISNTICCIDRNIIFPLCPICWHKYLNQNKYYLRVIGFHTCPNRMIYLFALFSIYIFVLLIQWYYSNDSCAQNCQNVNMTSSQNSCTLIITCLCKWGKCKHIILQWCVRKQSVEFYHYAELYLIS